jgi:hypothetical protein
MLHKINTAGEHAGEQQLHEEIQLLQGRGITGDKIFGEKKWKGQSLTLIELEEIKYFNQSLNQNVADLAMSCNLITRGVRLKEPVGGYYSITEVKLYGVELFEPGVWLG